CKPGYVAVRTREIAHQTSFHGLGNHAHDNRYGGRCLFGRASGCRSFDQHDVDGQPNQFAGEFWQSVGVARSRTKFKDQIMPFGISEPAHLLTECCEQRVRKFPTWCKDADARRPTRRLRPCRQRPRYRRAAEERDEMPPPHSITSSARASSVGGTS